MSRLTVILALRLLAVVVAIVPVAPATTAAERASVAGSTSTMTFDAVPAATREIGNPWRGAYEWQRTTVGPVGWPATDNYIRFRWSNLERGRDAYHWMDIDAQLERAKARGGKMGLRIVAVNSTDCGGSAVPQYLMDQLARGSWFQYPGCRPDQWLYLPDWNDEAFLSRAEAMLRALAARYGDDPRLGWVEIGFYGDFGEWHLWKIPDPSPSGAGPISDANARRLVDAHVSAFPTKRIISMKDHAYAFGYALGLSPNIGWRNECLGDEWFARSMGERFAQFPWAADRWKTAPVLTETCYEKPGTGGFARAVEQVRDFHVAMVGQGNMDPWERFSPDEQASWRVAVTSAGYRLAPVAVTVQSRVANGAPLAIDVTWRNDGVAPAYHERRARFSLVSPSTGAVAWSADSAYDVGAVLPGQAVHADAFALPIGIPPGDYDLVLTAIDPYGYHPPLDLAIGGRRPDGGYLVGSVAVVAP